MIRHVMHSGSQVTTKNTRIAPVISSTKTELLLVTDFFRANEWTVRLGFEMMTEIYKMEYKYSCVVVNNQAAAARGGVRNFWCKNILLLRLATSRMSSRVSEPLNSAF